MSHLLTGGSFRWPICLRTCYSNSQSFRHICDVRTTGFTSKTSLLLVVPTVLSIMEKMTQLSNAKTLSLESKTDFIFKQLSSCFLTLICTPPALFTRGSDDSAARGRCGSSPGVWGPWSLRWKWGMLTSVTVFAYCYFHESLKENTLVSLCDSSIYYHANMYRVPINISEKLVSWWQCFWSCILCISKTSSHR